MNIPDILIYSYTRLYAGGRIHPFFLTPLRKIIRGIAYSAIPLYFSHTKLVKRNKASNVIVSLTSFPQRIDNVNLVIQCFLRQSCMPKKIILWLSEPQFKNISLPDKLTSLQNETFEIRFVEGDIRSHKKYYYALRSYPDNPIFLADDDLYYPSDTLEKMLAASKKNPGCVICRYGNVVEYDKDGNILPYNEWFPWWKYVTGYSYDQNFFFGTGGGVLLRRDQLFDDVLNNDLAIKLTPYADDVWINAMVNLKGTRKVKIPFGILLETSQKKEFTLSKINSGQSMNDKQIEAIINYYNNLGLKPFYNRK